MRRLALSYDGASQIGFWLLVPLPLVLEAGLHSIANRFVGFNCGIVNAEACRQNNHIEIETLPVLCYDSRLGKPLNALCNQMHVWFVESLEDQGTD